MSMDLDYALTVTRADGTVLRITPMRHAKKYVKETYNKDSTDFYLKVKMPPVPW